MEHLATPPPTLALTDAHVFANNLPLPTYDHSAEGLPKLARLAAVCAQNPQLVNPALPPATQGLYYQAVYDHIHAFATSLANLATPAHVRPFQIHTFGPPACRPPIRASPAHAAFIRQEV